LAIADGVPEAGDDAQDAKVFIENELPASIVFDHPRILADYFRYKKTGQRPKP
jgi:8-oxo-dGTP diphosphatase